MLTDQIADMFTRIRNAIKDHRKTVSIPASNLKKEITHILYEGHFIRKYAFVEDGKQGKIKILLRYNERMNSAIRGLERVSKPGRRVYTGVEDMPKVLNGMGMAIVTTSQGVLTDRQCREKGIGGEVVARVW